MACWAVRLGQVSHFGKPVDYYFSKRNTLQRVLSLAEHFLIKCLGRVLENQTVGARCNISVGWSGAEWVTSKLDKAQLACLLARLIGNIYIKFCAESAFALVSLLTKRRSFEETA